MKKKVCIQLVIGNDEAGEEGSYTWGLKVDQSQARDKSDSGRDTHSKVYALKEQLLIFFWKSLITFVNQHFNFLFLYLLFKSLIWESGDI